MSGRIPTNDDLRNGSVKVLAWDFGRINKLRGLLVRIDDPQTFHWPYVVEDQYGNRFTFPFCEIEGCQIAKAQSIAAQYRSLAFDIYCEQRRLGSLLHEADAIRGRAKEASERLQAIF